MRVEPLKRLLDHYPALLQPVALPEPLGNAGGLSGASLWRFTSGAGALVARAWPIDGPDERALLQIHAWLDELTPLGFIPTPARTRDGRTFVQLEDRLWEVAPWMPGSAVRERPWSGARISAGFTALAAVHNRLGSTSTMGPSPGLARRLGEIEWLVGGGFAEFERAFSDPRHNRFGDLIREWIKLARPVVTAWVPILRRALERPAPLQPCLRDARAEHFLFQNDVVTGLVDFGAMGRDTVAGDLARLLGEAVGADPTARRIAMQAYASIRPLEAAESAAIEAFERANAILGAERWARWVGIEGRVFTDAEAPVRGIRRGIERLVEMIKAHP
jgi:homoserine kinase type II